MPRPHEDRQHHTPTDHHAGGPILTFAPNAWWAIDIAHVAANRADAGISAYETLIEKARTSAAKAHASVVLRSTNHRRVIALLHLDGHANFKHLASSWDDHHLSSERHAVAESSSLAFYRAAWVSGDATLDPTSTDAFAFEHINRKSEQLRALGAPVAAARGFRGATLFGTDDDVASAILYRFSHIEEIEAFRATPEAQRILGPLDTFYPVHVIRTFA
jgi:hypothetical protein